MNLRIAALYTHPIQYFAPLSRALAATPGVAYTCFFCDEPAAKRAHSDFGVPEEWGVPLTEGFDARILRNVGTRGGYGKLASYVNPGIVPALLRGGFDALVLHGYRTATHLTALATAKLAGTKVLLRGDSTAASADGPRQPSRALRRLFATADGALYVGERNREFYRAHGVTDDRLFFAPYSVDNYFFAARRAAETPRRAEIRRAWGIQEGACCLLFAGRLADEKGLDVLLEGFKRAADAGTHLLIAGDGPLRETLASRARDARIHDRVTFAGFLDQAGLARAYVAADTFVLPSRFEPWGLVVNEAMNFALPILASDRVGCAPDLVTAENGRILPHDAPDRWAEAITMLASSREQRQQMGASSLRRIASWSPEHTAAGVVAAVQGLLALRK